MNNKNPISKLLELYERWFGKYFPITFLLFGIVGTSGLVINLIFFGLGEYLGFPKFVTGISERIDPIYLSVPFGYQIAIFWNYFLNNRFTFKKERHHGYDRIKGFLYYEAFSLISLVIHWLVFQLLQNNYVFYGLVAEELRKYVSNSIGTIFAFLSNYFLNRKITWKNSQ